MKYYSILFISLFMISCSVKKQVATQKNNDGDLIGFATKSSFSQPAFKSWFFQQYLNYKVDTASAALLKENLEGVTIKAFMGTWCSDSKRELPQLYKLLDDVYFNEENLEVVAVNRNKKTPDNLQRGYKLKRVPTVIFYKEGKEIGRYVERARESLQKDVLKIVSGQDYTPVYSKRK